MNEHFVLPKTYLTGYTTINIDGLTEYLKDTDQLEFLKEIDEAKNQGISDGEILCSFYAKACYASLTTKKNKNISKTRPIYNNLVGILDSGHGSVIEHCFINFMITNCSRIFTHELIRHRVGTAYSQTSGRYVRTNILNVVVDPILKPIYDLCEESRRYQEDWYKKAEEKLGLNSIKDFVTKKKMTSALRRFLPNGLANEIGVSLNLRSLRHTIEMRTNKHAEWEIRVVFNQIYYILKDKYPIMFVDVKTQEIDGALEITFKNKKV